jgi:hypothetical protein
MYYEHDVREKALAIKCLPATTAPYNENEQYSLSSGRSTTTKAKPVHINAH